MVPSLRACGKTLLSRRWPAEPRRTTFAKEGSWLCLKWACFSFYIRLSKARPGCSGVGVGVKHLSGRWLWTAPLILVLIVVGSLLLVGRSRVESAGGKGIVELAFTGTLISGVGVPIASQYQRVTLNVQSI